MVMASGMPSGRLKLVFKQDTMAMDRCRFMLGDKRNVGVHLDLGVDDIPHSVKSFRLVLMY